MILEAWRLGGLEEWMIEGLEDSRPNVMSYTPRRVSGQETTRNCPVIDPREEFL